MNRRKDNNKCEQHLIRNEYAGTRDGMGRGNKRLEKRDVNTIDSASKIKKHEVTTGNGTKYECRCN